MPQNFLDLHIVDFCQLDCKHCYLKKGKRVMPLDMLRTICEDFLSTNFPLPRSDIILSGGEPLLHPKFVEAYSVVRELIGHVALATNGILIPKYIHIFHKNDGIQVSVDGDEKAHDFIRGKGSYEKAVRALKLLDEHGIRHTLSFTINQANKHCIDHIIDLCIETGAHTLNFNIYQPIRKSDLEPIRYMEWIEIKKYVEKRAEKEGIYLPEGCIEGGCIARILGGTAAFDHGGFILDGGHLLRRGGGGGAGAGVKHSFLPSSASEVPPPPVLFQHPLPEDWFFVLAIPHVKRGA